MSDTERSVAAVCGITVLQCTRFYRFCLFQNKLKDKMLEKKKNLFENLKGITEIKIKLDFDDNS